MSYPPPGGTPDPYQPQQPYGQPAHDPTTPYQQDPFAAPASGQPYGGTPSSGQPYGGAPSSGQPYGAPSSGQPYGPPNQDPYAQQPPPPYGQQPYTGYGPGYPAVPGTNVMAILALVFAFIFAPASIVLGHIAKKQIRQTGEQGEGLATAGLWLGYIFTGLAVAMCALWGVLIAVAANSSSSGGY